ncbi:uncharacterized protein [Dysidea avara]|uniref:uncharacterized protein n=1 Tax=Dysidea avara TaxID=196820 RepID=UPI003328BC12
MMASDDVMPPEASLAAAEASVKFKYIDSPELEDPCWLPDDTPLINSEEQPIAKTALDQMDIIALYFSAEWCPPCNKFMPKLLKFYNYLKEEERKFELVYVSNDNTKESMLAYMKDQHMPWVGLSFDSPLGEQLRTNFKVAAIPLLVILSRNGKVISDYAKKPVESASSSHDEITRLYNNWMRKLLEINGIPVPEEEPEKKGGIFSSLFSGGKKKDRHQDKKQDKKQQSPPQNATEDHIDEAPPVSKQKNKMNEKLLCQKEQLEREKSMERQKVGEKTKKLHDTLASNAQMQKELEQKEEKIRILEAKNETLKQTAEAKTNEVEELKQKLAMLETELSSKAAEEKKLYDEKRELLANISLHGWLCKRGVKGPTANSWRRRYFRIEEGSKLTYYKTAGEGPPRGFIDIDGITSVITPPAAQQDKNNCTFHLVTDGRTYELLAHDEANMKKWLSNLQYMKEWRAKQKREAQQ